MATSKHDLSIANRVHGNRGLPGTRLVIRRFNFRSGYCPCMVFVRFIHSTNSFGQRVSRMPSLRIHRIVWTAILALLLRENAQTTRELYNVGYIARKKLSTLHIHHIYSDRRNAHCRRKSSETASHSSSSGRVNSTGQRRFSSCACH